MSSVIPFRRRSKHQYTPLALAALIAVVFGFAATWAFVTWQSEGVDISRYVPWQSGGISISRYVPWHPIQVIDGDTVRFNGAVYRLVGIDTPERGNKARCDDERRRAEAATKRLRALVASGDAHLTRVACACRPGQEGTRKCDYGRLCGSLSIGGRDAGDILISEGHARRYLCGATSCPERWPWC